MSGLLLPKTYLDQKLTEEFDERVRLGQEPHEFRIYRTCDVWRFLKLIQDSDARLVSVIHEPEPITGEWIVRYFHDEALSMELHT